MPYSLFFFFLFEKAAKFEIVVGGALSVNTLLNKHLICLFLLIYVQVNISFFQPCQDGSSSVASVLSRFRKQGVLKRNVSEDISFTQAKPIYTFDRKKLRIILLGGYILYLSPFNSNY